ncbi:squalene synthase [Mycena alexandri]|uniref:Squalene synthase n=1 Tax=Mycena alexandri TaxID=1745969 RepID=A0AAD6SYC7_9AGAR|nr:squalene synthase [Mycena alexandri]
MAFATYLLLLLTHPMEFRTLVQYSIYHDKRDITAPSEHPSTGWDRASMRRCWELLDLTSRSFSSVIKGLEGDLARVVCLFYLVLRALDTVEDDMTLPSHVKQPILRAFHQHTLTPGWHFTDSGPDEKDREVLVDYAVVVEELGRLPAADRDAIVSIAQKMGLGMADFAARAESYAANKEKAGEGEDDGKYLPTIASYELYCHYVAGLVGEGLCLLFAASGKESPIIADQLELSNHMGLLLQKTNITRDVREDVEEGRFFWPREIWGSAKYGKFERMEQLCEATPKLGERPSAAFNEKAALAAANGVGQEQALYVLSAQILDALRHAPPSLDYLRLLRNQSTFNFCAIPVTMAMATLELCFMNPKVLGGNVKIRKAEAAGLIMRSTNPREVSLIFREYARRIHARASPRDPSFIGISVACGKIEQWCEHYYPSFIQLSTAPASPYGSSPSTRQAINHLDARGRTHLFYEKLEADRVQLARVEKFKAEVASGKRKPVANAGQGDVGMWELAGYVGGGIAVLIAVIFGVVWFILQISD